MKIALFSFLAATIFLTVAESASAQGIFSLGVTDVRNQTITLNGNTAWAAFSNPNGSPGAAVTNAANPGGFTDLAGSIDGSGGDSVIGITYTGGAYDTTGGSLVQGLVLLVGLVTLGTARRKASSSGMGPIA